MAAVAAAATERNSSNAQKQSLVALHSSGVLAERSIQRVTETDEVSFKKGFEFTGFSQ